MQLPTIAAFVACALTVLAAQRGPAGPGRPSLVARAPGIPAQGEAGLQGMVQGFGKKLMGKMYPPGRARSAKPQAGGALTKQVSTKKSAATSKEKCTTACNDAFTKEVGVIRNYVLSWKQRRERPAGPVPPFVILRADPSDTQDVSTESARRKETQCMMKCGHADRSAPIDAKWPAKKPPVSGKGSA